MNKLLNNFTF